MDNKEIKEAIEEAMIKANFAPIMDKEVAVKLQDLGFQISPFAPVMAKSFYVTLIAEAHKISKFSKKEARDALNEQIDNRKEIFNKMLEDFRVEINTTLAD
jgi:hypothetical protein